MNENNLINQFECPENYEECVALKLLSNGVSVLLEKTGNSHAVLSGANYVGEVYCSDPLTCSRNYLDIKTLIEINQ